MNILYNKYIRNCFILHYEDQQQLHFQQGQGRKEVHYGQIPSLATWDNGYQILAQQGNIQQVYAGCIHLLSNQNNDWQSHCGK